MMLSLTTFFWLFCFEICRVNKLHILIVNLNKLFFESSNTRTFSSSMFFPTSIRRNSKEHHPIWPLNNCFPDHHPSKWNDPWPKTSNHRPFDRGLRSCTQFLKRPDLWWLRGAYNETCKHMSTCLVDEWWKQNDSDSIIIKIE